MIPQFCDYLDKNALLDFFVKQFKLKTNSGLVVHADSSTEICNLADKNVPSWQPSSLLFTFKTWCSEVSVQFSCSVVSDSLWTHGPQHARTPCPSQTPRVCKTHVYWISDAIQPSHPLLSPSPPAFNLSQHQGLFKLVSSLHQVAKALEFQLQYQSF